MALTYGFYNSLNGDRRYNAEEFGEIFNGVVNDGVFVNIGEHFAVTPLSGMSIKVGTGRAWFDGTWTKVDSQIPLTLDNADVTLARIDAVVLEVDHRVETRANSIKIVKGTPASTPQKPTLTNDTANNVYQHPLAYVTVNAGATSISASKIEIVVGTSACPYVTSVLQSTSIDDLFNGWDDEFTSWFDNIKAQLSDNVVTNLQNQIDTNAGDITTLTNALAEKLAVAALATTSEAQAGTLDTKWMSPLKVKQAINSIVGSPAKIATGSYTGTGTYGSSNPCSITFGSLPCVILLMGSGEDNSGSTLQSGAPTWFMPQAMTTNQNWSAGHWSPDISLLCRNYGSYITWYSNDNANHQRNISGKRYRYVIIRL